MDKKIYKLFNEYPQMINFLNYISSKGDIFFIGGLARLLYTYDIRPQTINSLRDIDMIVNLHDESQSLDNILSDYKYTKNKFDGYKIELDGIKIDMWEVKNTWAYRNNIVSIKESKLRIIKLEETVFLNYDALIYDYNKGFFYDKHYLECVNSGILDVILLENPEPLLNYARGIEIAKLNNFKLSDKFIEILQNEYIKDNQLPEKIYQRYHERSNKISLEDIKQTIMKGINYDAGIINR